MRKKLLRSRTGFEKPESREEAIMQNILGASNVLEPSESNIEEILKSILYNTPYTKEAEFEIEKILLAIKNNGTYDGEFESRDMKILIAILKDLDYTEEAESRIEELFIEWLHQRSSIKVLEGVPPLTFTSRGLPLINYLIEGNTVQSGTPTPPNPVDVIGVGKMSENLMNRSGEESGYINSQGEVRTPADGWILSDYIPVNPNSTYTFKPNSTGGTSAKHAYYDTNKELISVLLSGEQTFITPNNAAYMRFSYRSNSVNVMLNLGSTALPYEPFGVKIPISSAGQTSNIYLGEVETTRKIKKLVLTGDDDENWNITNNSKVLYLAVSDFLKEQGTICYCTHYKTVNNVSSADDVNDGECTFNGHLNWLYIKDSNYTSAQGFKNYLTAQYAAGTPVTVWYVLATPETGIVNEPLRKIGDYADTLSMEQAGVQIPTNNGTTVIDVDTTVKPSNIYIEYK